MGKSKFDKTCTVCQGSYKYCSGCSDYAHYPRWMESFCSDNCRKIFNIYMKNKAGLMNNAEAKAELLKCDLSNKDHFEEGLKAGIEAILSDPSKVEVPKADPVEEPKVEEPAVEDEKVEEPKPVEEPKAEEPKEEESKTNNPPSLPKNNKFNGYKKNNYKR